MIRMRQYNAFEARNVRFLVNEQIEFATLQVTETGLRKSIMDATAPVRVFLKEKGIHDFESQLKGPVHKRMVQTYILTEWSSYLTKTSLYRPVTKKGDPRLWVNKVRGVEFLRPGDIFALITRGEVLYAVNLSTVDIPEVVRASLVSPLKDLIFDISGSRRAVSEELLDLIRERLTDWIPSEIHADTGVGRTVESLLGIPMNSSRTPDYKGIELKSHRKPSKVRNTLFTQAPQWEISKLKSGRAIVDRYGYVPDGYGHKSLHVTLSALRPNPQGLGLVLLPKDNRLEVDEFSPLPHEDDAFVKVDDVAAWHLNSLHERLLSKHRETFWIDVETENKDGIEYFRCTEILHTKNPIVSQFDVLLDQGDITVDLLLCRRSGGDTYSFKIKDNARPLLFPENDIYVLRS